ncbi:MAG TPA: alpha/beta hydrolase [Anaerolineales bacterium]|nr:alpha/beta hydrolase [Anaerolineales bacterium]
MNLSPLFWTPILLAVSISVFLAVAARARTRLKGQYPPIGQMVDIGGYRLHMHVEGEGGPTVVFDAGAGGIGLSWELVRPAIAKVTRVVVYDRAGLGWSDPSPCPRDAYTMAVELHTLLTNANIPAPYILVGHSLGGSVARQFAAKYPNEVAGLVMVDSAHEAQVKHFPEALVKMVNSMKGMLGAMTLISELGIFALKPNLISVGDNGKLPNELVEQMRAVIATSNSHAKTLVAETESVFAAQTQPVATLSDLPLTVISHGDLDANAVPPSLGQKVREEYEAAWQKLQAEITSLSTRARRIVAERSGHNVMFDQPETVIESILEMLRLTQESHIPIQLTSCDPPSEP